MSRFKKVNAGLWDSVQYYSLTCELYCIIIKVNTMVGIQKEGDMEVEIIKANNPFNESSKVRKVDRLRVAAYCRVSTDDEDQIKSYNSMVKYYTELIQNNEQWVFAGVYADKAITGTKVDKEKIFSV